MGESIVDKDMVEVLKKIAINQFKNSFYDIVILS